MHVAPLTLLEKMKTVKSLTWTGIGNQIPEVMLESYAWGAGIGWYGRGAGSHDASKQQTDGWRQAEPIENLARWVGIHGWQKRQNGNVVDVNGELHAIYVRPSDAELNKDVQNKI